MTWTTMRTLLLLLSFTMATRSQAQDIIITTAGDTIRCTIDLVREKKIHFTEHDGAGRSYSSMRKEQIASYHQRGFAPVILHGPRPIAIFSPAPPARFAPIDPTNGDRKTVIPVDPGPGTAVSPVAPEQSAPADSTRGGHAPVTLHDPQPTTGVSPAPLERSAPKDSTKGGRDPMWSIFVGRSYLRMLSPDFDNGEQQWLGHFDDLRKGALDHIGFNCFVRPQFGIGVRITTGNWSSWTEDLPIYYEDPYGGVDSVALVDVKSNVGLLAFGPALVLRLSKPSDKAIFTVGLNGGVSIYTEEHELDDERQFFGGESLYASVSLAMDIRLGKIMTLGAVASYAVSTLDRVKIAVWTDQTQKLLRPEATIGLRRATVGLQLGVVF